jgi:hypothetical protein
MIAKRLRWLLVAALILGQGAGPGAASTAAGPATAQGGATSIRERARPRFEHLFDIPVTAPGMAVTMIHDASDRPFLYVACKEAGLRVYDVRESPRLVRSIPIRALAGLDVMSLSQTGDRLYLALGNHWGRGGGIGLAVLDVSDPARARVAGVWKDPEGEGGSGAVVARGRTAYLAAMGNGLILLDVAKPARMRVTGRLRPDLAFPDARPDPKKINARGLALRENLLFLTYDAGGLRVIDVENRARPREIGRYANPAMNGRPRAYNHLVLDGSLAYVTVDYVGLEILDISDPRAIEPVAWWNPWNPQRNPWRWFSSPGHTNEIAYDAQSRTVLMSAGRSDLVAVDVSDPAHPRQVGGIGEVGDTKATWGLSMYGDLVYLSYIRTLGIPFRANWSGVRIFRYLREPAREPTP